MFFNNLYKRKTMIYNRLLVNDKSIENVCVWESYLPVTGMTMITKVVVHIRRPLLHWAWPLSWLIFVVNPQWVTHVNNFWKRGFRFRSGPFTHSILSLSHSPDNFWITAFHHHWLRLDPFIWSSCMRRNGALWVDYWAKKKSLFDGGAPDGVVVRNLSAFRSNKGLD